MSINTQFTRPLSNRQGFALIDYTFCAAFIILLLFLCPPIAILRGIISIIISTLNRMFRSGAIAHIGVEVLKRILPPLTNGYSASAITMKVGNGRQPATAQHTVPSFKFRRISHSVGAESFRGLFTLKTPTTNNQSSQYCCSNFVTDVAALTFTQPHGIRAFDAEKSQNGQSSEYLTLKVFETMRSWFWLKISAILIVGHLAFSLLEQNLIRAVGKLIFSLRPVSIIPQRLYISYT